MKRIGLAIILMTACALLPVTSQAADGAAVYKAKCSACHGAQGEGKPAMKAPALKGTKVTGDQAAALLEKGDAARKAPHTKPVNGLTEDDVKAVVEYVKGLK